MGLPALKRLMSLQRVRGRKRRRRQLRARMNKRKGSPYQPDEDGGSQTDKRMRSSVPELPEDILCHIHSLMPLRDAAHAACLSRTFLHSWRCRPNLTLNMDTLCSKAHTHKADFSDTIDRIMRNRSGIGVKILKLELFGIAYHNLDSWLQVAVTPGIEELTVAICRLKKKCNFPCSLLSNGVGNSIRFLDLGECEFHPTAELGPSRSLTSLNLVSVRITGNELECLLSNSLVLKQLNLLDCDEIICLKIPCVLQRFSRLSVVGCCRLQVIENQAPNLSSLDLCPPAASEVIGEISQVKNLSMHRSDGVCYARAYLPSIMPNLNTLLIGSGCEVVNTPMPPTKFIYLKHLTIHLRSGTTTPPYDYFSFVSFLDASPSLETFILDVIQERMEHESVLGHSSDLRQIAEHQHCSVRTVKITGFSSAKSLVELTCHILKNAVSLESLTLDPLYGFRCSDVCRCLCRQ